MNRFIAILAISLFTFYSNYASAQTKSRNDSPGLFPENYPIQDNAPIVEPYDGTYRFIFTKGIKQVFTNDIFQVIEQNRKEGENVVFVLSNFCKVQILSRKQILSTDFKPFLQSFIFEQD